MNQPNLFDVPKDSPSHQERLDALKTKIGIWTHETPGETSREFPKWMAMLMPVDGDGVERYSDHRSYCDSDEPMEIIAGYCRIMDETGRCQYGHTELEAVRTLCDRFKLPCPL